MEPEVIISSPSSNASSAEDERTWEAEHQLMRDTLQSGPNQPPDAKDLSIYALASYAQHLHDRLNASQPSATVDMSSLQSVRATREILELANTNLKTAEKMMSIVGVNLHNTERHVMERASDVERGAWKIQSRILDAVKQGLTLVKVWTCSDMSDDDEEVEIDQPFPWVGRGDPEPEMPGRLKVIDWGFTYTFCCENKDEVAAAMNFDSAEFDSFEGMSLSNAAFVDIFGYLPVSRNDAGIAEVEVEDHTIVFAYDVSTKKLTVSAQVDPVLCDRRLQ